MLRFIWLLLITVFIFSCGGEAPTSEQTTEETTTTTTEEPAPAAEKTAASTSVLNPNLATKEELAALSQLDEEIAQHIIDSRPFLNMNDFLVVLTGAMDENAMTDLFATCFVPLNLNIAAEEEFLMVPGVGEKMAHEFEEYRPYKKLAQFRREMGKYVDDAEIARYEKYVFVPVALNSATDEEILAIPGVGDRMLHEFKEYRPFKNMEQFQREIGKYVDEKELARLARFVYVDVEN